MITFLRRCYSLLLIAALVLPLWLHGALNAVGPLGQRFKDALIWSAVLFGAWLLMRLRPAFQVKGVWRQPSPAERAAYTRMLLAVLLIDVGSKALFFRWDRPYQVELIKNFGLHSVFHETQFEIFHLIVLLYFFYVFFVGAWFFRFSSPLVDRLWIGTATFALGGALALFGERLLFGGVHNSFYFAGPLMWICPPCASPHFASYAWTPADLFVHAAAVAPALVFASCVSRPAPSASG